MQLLTEKYVVSEERSWYMYIVLSEKVDMQNNHEGMTVQLCKENISFYQLVEVQR